MTAIETFKSLIDTHRQRLEALRDEMRAEGNKVFGGLFTEFFEAVPQVDAIAWTQYTPHWNDGDTCEFSVHDPEYLAAPEDEDIDAEDAEVLYDGWGHCPDGFTAEQFQAMKDLSALLESMQDYLLDQFGDHMKIIVTRGGVDVQEYEHD